MKLNFINWGDSLVLLVALLLHSMLVEAQESRVIKGKVYDADSRELLVGVSVFSDDRKAGTVSNQAGCFDMEGPVDGDSITLSYMGYQSKKVCVCEMHANEGISIALQPASQSLQTMVVTASRDRQERTEAPIAISALSAQQLNETRPTLLSEAMNKIPGVLMVNLGNEQHSMSIRQPMSYKGYYLYLEDGIPIRPAGLFNHNALIEVNMFSLRTIEVIRGPASSVYGSEAIGGAINFITLAPPTLPAFKIGVHGDNWGYKRMQFNGGGFVSKKLGVVASGYMANQKDSWQGHSDFDKLSINLRADYFLDDRTKLIAGFSKNELDSEMGGSLDSTGFYSRSYNTLHTFTYRKVNAVRAKVGVQRFWNQSAESNLKLFYRNNTIDQLPAYAIGNIWDDQLRAHGEENSNSFQSYGIMAQHQQELSWAGAKLLTGLYVDYSPSSYQANYVAVEREQGSGRYTGFTSLPDSLLSNYQANLLNTALFVQAEASPLPKLKLVAGLRYDRIGYVFDNHLPPSAFSGAPDEKNNFTFFTPKIGATYAIYQNTGMYGNISNGAYAPGINELYRGVKVPHLKHARFSNYELGFWSGLWDNKLYLEACLYAMKGMNEIVSYTLADGSTENRNTGETLHMGVEYSLKYMPVKELLFRFGGTNAAHTYISYTTKEEQDFSGNSMPNAPTWIANAEVTYKPSFLPGFYASLEWQRVSSWYMDEANTVRYNDQTFMGMEGVSALNFRTAYTLKGAELYLNIMNLSNELYAHNVTKNQWGNVYNPAAARTFTFGIAYQFMAKEGK